MTIEDSDLSRAVVLYLGFELSPSPRQDQDSLVQAFGQSKAELLGSQVSMLLKEVASTKIDWNLYSLQSAGALVEKNLQHSHPELSQAAMRALAWKFTFDWR